MDDMGDVNVGNDGVMDGDAAGCNAGDDVASGGSGRGGNATPTSSSIVRAMAMLFSPPSRSSVNRD